jgi:photosystem II stability/assembly factor-like uncharacterized protein
MGFGFVLTSCEKETENPLLSAIVTKEFQGWKPMFAGTVDDLNDIYFINDNSGWVVGENKTLIATASGDRGWSRAPVDLPLENLRCVFFVDDQVGWIAGDLSGNPIMGQVGYTSNGGGYPVQQKIFDKPLNSLFFIDRQVGWAAGENGLMVHTLNGGLEWQIIPSFTDQPIYDLYFGDDGSGWAATGAGGIFYTKDDTVWEMETTGIDADILSLHFPDESNGWACGEKNTILRRERMLDGTYSWNRTTILTASVNQIWNDIFFIDDSTGWVVGELGQIYKTTDAGTNWMAQVSNVTSDLNAIHMVSSKKGWIAGDNGNILSFGAQ